MQIYCVAVNWAEGEIHEMRKILSAVVISAGERSEVLISCAGIISF